MFLYAALFVILRTFVQVVCDDYASKSSVCDHLLKKALAETLPDIRSAYFLKVMEADNKAIAQTFTTYHISFLVSDTTYASENEITNHACKMPNATREFLNWTSGVLPLFGVYVFYVLVVGLWKRCKRKPVAVVQVKEAEIEMTAPPKDTPPRTPLYVPQQEPQKQRGVRRRKGQSRERDTRQSPRREAIMKPRKPEGPSVMEQMSAISPALKHRIMGDDPMV